MISRDWKRLGMSRLAETGDDGHIPIAIDGDEHAEILIAVFVTYSNR
jgi:hypothetical protein